jgi:hypothetical protein
VDTEARRRRSARCGRARRDQLGAVIGGLTTHHLHDAALWVPAAFLLAALLDIFRRVLSNRSTES